VRLIRRCIDSVVAHPIKWQLAFSLLAGIVAGVVAMYMAWRHDPQCAVHCPQSGVFWGHWLGLGASWVIEVAVLLSLSLGILTMVVRAGRPRPIREDQRKNKDKNRDGQP